MLKPKWVRDAMEKRHLQPPCQHHCFLPAPFSTPMDTLPTTSPLVYSHSVKLTPADLTELFGVLASPFALWLILIWQSQATYPCLRVRAVGRLQAEPSAATLLLPCAALSEAHSSPHHTVFSWTVGLCSSVALLSPRHFVWPWKKVRCSLQVGVRWKSAP